MIIDDKNLHAGVSPRGAGQTILQTLYQCIQGARRRYEQIDRIPLARFSSYRIGWRPLAHVQKVNTVKIVAMHSRRPRWVQNLLPRCASVMEELARIPDAKGAQPPRRFMIDEMTASTNGRRFARSTSVTGRHGRRR
jgi:hypothetical protein